MVYEYAPRSVKQAITGKGAPPKTGSRHAETPFKKWMKCLTTGMQVMGLPWRFVITPEWKHRKLFRHI